jgi:hypothetical protein
MLLGACLLIIGGISAWRAFDWGSRAEDTKILETVPPRTKAAQDGIDEKTQIAMPESPSRPAPGPDALGEIAQKGNWSAASIVRPTPIEEYKQKLIRKYMTVPPADLIRMGEEGNADAALLANDILHECTAVKPALTEPYCLDGDQAVVRRRTLLMLSAAKATPGLDHTPLLLAASELSTYGARTEENRRLMNDVLDTLHAAARNGNATALRALSYTYYHGKISKKNDAYSLALNAIATFDRPDRMEETRNQVLLASSRPGDIVSATEYAKLLRTGQLPPLYCDEVVLMRKTGQRFVWCF